MSYDLSAEEKIMTPGTYDIYAYAYSSPTGYYLGDEALDESVVANNADRVIAYKHDGTNAGVATNNLGEEIFAGKSTFTVENNTSASGTVVLNRQVAGAFAYVEKIPYIENTTVNSYLRVISRYDINTELVIGKLDLSSYELGNTLPTT